MIDFESYRNYCREDGVNPDNWDDYECKAYCFCRKSLGWDIDNSKEVIDNNSYYWYDSLEDYGQKFLEDFFSGCREEREILLKHLDCAGFARDIINENNVTIGYFDG